MFCYLFNPWKGLPPNIPCWDGPPVPPKRLVTGGFVDDAKPKDGPFDCVRFEKREGCDGFEGLLSCLYLLRFTVSQICTLSV